MNNMVPAMTADPPKRTGRSVLFGAVSLIAGEHGKEYQALLDQITAAVEPSDILEEIWVRDVMDLTWECFRLRRLKANLMMTAAFEGLRNVLKPLIGPTEAVVLADDWVVRDTDAIERVEKLLASADLTMDAVMAETLSIRLDDIERFDRMIAMAEARRSATLREVERHRDALARKLRRANDEALDALIEEVQYGPSASNATA
jgi:hypothetical protein